MVSKKPIISAKNLRKCFGTVTAVDSISFAVEEGGLFAFLGPNGAGKTTTIKMLTTLLSPDSGSLSVDGFDVRTQPMEVRRSIGIVFQDQSLDDELTAYENMHFHAVLYGVESTLRAQRIPELLRLVELYEKRDMLVKTFSGGMKRRLEIARALLHHPRVLFLDEPTVGLDPQTRNSIWAYLHALNKKEGMTIFFTTHYMEEAEKAADHIAIIDKGSIIMHGTASALLAKTATTTLEEAFLKLTGKTIRDESASSAETMRNMRKVWRR